MITPEGAVAATATTPGMPPYQDTFPVGVPRLFHLQDAPARTALLREPPPRGILNEDR